MSSKPEQPLDVLAVLDRINGHIARASSQPEMMQDVLDDLLEIFDCDRAWLLFPCDPDAECFDLPIERTRPEFPGAGARVPISPWISQALSKCLQRRTAVAFGPLPEQEHADPESMLEFGIKSQLIMAISSGDGEDWAFGIHDCRQPRDYRSILQLFETIGHRVGDALKVSVALRNLRRSEERFRTLVEHAPEAIVIFDVGAVQFVDANRRAVDLFQVSRNELLKRGGPAAISPELQPDGRRSDDAAKAYLQKALDGHEQSFEWVHLNARGEPIDCEVRLVRMPDPERSLVRGSIVDIRARRQVEQERKELESKLAQSQKMEAIGQLTGGVAHDFNNLLTVILGNAELLEADSEDPPFVREVAGHIRAAAERASALTHRLLAFSRRQPLRPETIDAGRLLRGMDDLLRRSLGETVDVELVLGGGLWPCEVDATQLESAVLNLAINARDAMPPQGGRLTIEAGNARLDAEYATNHDEVKPGQYVLVAVTDSGSGMSDDVQARVFEPFFTTKEVGRGSGLGLSMVYGFVKQSGGHVKVYSEEGEGTTVKLYLPRAAPHHMQRLQRSSGLEHFRGQGQCVLVVEDDPSVLGFTCTLLERLGYRSLKAADGAQGLQLLREHPEVQVLLTDVVLTGGMNGAELAEQAQHERPDLRVLFMSGYTENAIIHNGRLDHNVRLIEKPFTQRTLATHLRDALKEEPE